MSLESVLEDIANGPREHGVLVPSPDALASAIDEVMQGTAQPTQVAALLMGMRCRGEKPAHLKAVVDVMLSHSLPFPAFTGETLFDTCGPGGIGRSLVNISTAAAILAAAAGIPVAKHGNRSVSSIAGSADVLTALGVKVDCAAENSAESLRETGFAFLFAPLYHPAMKHAGPVRREIKFRTIFNLAGPLSNPARPTHQLVGVGRRELMSTVAETLQLLGRKSALVVHGRNGLDEISLAQATEGLHLTEKGEIEHVLWEPSDFGVDAIETSDLAITSPQDSAKKIKAVLEGKRGPIANEINANVAAVIWLTGRSTEIAQCFQLARQVQESGAGAELLKRVVPITNG